MGKYTQLEPYEILALTKRYGLKVSEYTAIEGGAANSSFFFRAKGNEYVLTVADDRSVEEVLVLVNLLDHLAEHEFPTSRVVSTLDGEKVIFYGEKAVYIKEFIPGTIIRKISKGGLLSLGMSLARLHQIPSPKGIPQTHSYGMYYFSSAYGKNFDPEFEDWLGQKEGFFKGEISNGLPRGLIHADVFWDNIIYDNDEFQALIDFEDACNYFKVYDLGSAFHGICVEGGELNLKKAAQIVKGYEQFRDLESNEKKALQVLTVYAGVAISYWRYLKYNLTNPVEEKKNFHKKSAEVADRIQAIPAEIFSQVFDY